MIIRQNQYYKSFNSESYALCARKSHFFRMFLPRVSRTITALLLCLPANCLYFPLCFSSVTSDCVIKKTNQQMTTPSDRLSFAHLPSPGSKKWKQYINDIQTAFRENGSYAILDTRELFDERISRDFFNSMQNSPGTNSQIIGNNIIVTGADQSIVKSFEITPEQQNALKAINKWMSSLLKEAFNNQVPLNEKPIINLRSMSKGAGGVKFEKWHLDGGDKSVIVVLEGTGTELLGTAPLGSRHDADFESILGKTNVKRVPRGYTLIFTGADGRDLNARLATVHRTPPGLNEDRAILIIRY